MNTNTKEFMKKVQSFIVNDWEWTPDRIWAYYHENGSKMWESYVHIMAKNLVCLAENKRNYLNK